METPENNFHFTSQTIADFKIENLEASDILFQLGSTDRDKPPKIVMRICVSGETWVNPQATIEELRKALDLAGKEIFRRDAK